MRKLVVKSSSTVYGACAQGPGHVHRGHGAEARCRGPASPRTRSRSRGTSAGSPGAVRTSRSPTLRFANFLGPADRDPDDRVLLAAGRARPCSASTRGCSSCTRTTGSRCCAAPPSSDHPGTFNVAGDGVLLLSQAVRRAGRPTLPLLAPFVSSVGGLVRRARAGRLLPRAAAVPHLRSRARHHPDAQPARLRAAVHDVGHLRRLRAGAPAEPVPAAVERSRPSRTGWLRCSWGAGPMADAKVIPIGDGDPAKPRRPRAKKAAAAHPAAAAGRAAAGRAGRSRAAAAERGRAGPCRGGRGAAAAARRRRPRRQGGRGVGLPAPPDHRRLRRRRLRLRPRADRQGAARGAAPAVPARGSGSRPAASRTCRTPAARWWWPTTRAPSRSTR